MTSYNIQPKSRLSAVQPIRFAWVNYAEETQEDLNETARALAWSQSANDAYRVLSV